jgi:folate-dependent phosphoribosylglycinamide formyltransferase PurN
MTIKQTVDLIKTGYIDPSQVREAEPVLVAINQRVANALEKATPSDGPLQVKTRQQIEERLQHLAELRRSASPQSLDLINGGVTELLWAAGESLGIQL